MARLIIVAREDAGFRQPVLRALELPVEQRDLLVRAAVAEKRRRKEPERICAAFEVLATNG